MTHTSHRDAKLCRTWPQLLPHITIPQLKTKLPLNFQDHPQLVILTKGGSFLKYTYTLSSQDFFPNLLPAVFLEDTVEQLQGPGKPKKNPNKPKTLSNSTAPLSTSFSYWFQGSNIWWAVFSLTLLQSVLFISNTEGNKLNTGQPTPQPQLPELPGWARKHYLPIESHH